MNLQNTRLGPKAAPEVAWEIGCNNTSTELRLFQQLAKRQRLCAYKVP